jgi:POTRA domain-containing FtsQ-type protein
MNWFHRHKKNRRLGSAHVLDVKLRSDDVRASRFRLIAGALGLIFATVLGFYGVWRAGEFALDKLVYENDSFAIEQIDAETDGVLAPEQLRRWAGVKPGENLLALDMGRVKRDLEMVPIIRSVAVERILPNTLRLRVSERDPIAQVPVLTSRGNGAVQTNALHLDAEGYVMALVEADQRAAPLVVTNDYLPVIIGIKQTDLLLGRKVACAQAYPALQFISAYERSPMSALVDLAAIDISSPQVLEVTTTQGSRITFAIGAFDIQLRRWQETYERAQRSGWAIGTLDLSVSNNIPATWLNASTVPQVPHRTKNLQPNRKHNV